MNTDKNNSLNCLNNSSSVKAVSVQNLAKYFQTSEKTVKAVDGISLEVEKGDFVAVMGASGSGKSTLLHLLSGLTEPTSGTVLIENQALSGMTDKERTRLRRQRVGIVFQAFNLIPTLTVEENIVLPILADGKKQVSVELLEQILTRLNLSEQRMKLPDLLSGGEQQRVALARALLIEPTLLLADEPTGNLDSVNAQNICQILSELNREQKRTIIVVTHEPSVAIWSNRILVLKDGKILADFPTSSCKDAHELAAKYQDIQSLHPMDPQTEPQTELQGSQAKLPSEYLSNDQEECQ